MATKFSSSTPTDISSIDIDNVLDYAGEDGDKNVSSPTVRLRLTKMLYDVLGMTLTPDIALATIAEPSATLVLATAGGGKTTWAQIKAILEKLMRKSVYHPGKKIRGDSILCLVYNKHNVKDMTDRHRDMVAQLVARGIRGLDIDSDIHASTLHSFCDFWRREFVADMDLLGATLLEQAQAEAFMKRAIRIACKKMGCEKRAVEIDPANALSLYTYYRESMCTEITQLTKSDKFVDLGADIELVQVIFERYDASKKLQHKYDFVDMLYKFYCLMRDNDRIRERVQRYYEYIIADEVQDFTPLMWEILRLMVSDGTPLTCIGDEDQNIYSFRGADIYNTLEFEKMFPGGRIYLLEYNRRCGSVVLDEARKVIEMNTLRFNKILRSTRDGGSVTYKPYNSLHGQFLNVIKSVKELTAAEQESTVICYREGASSTILTDMLMSEDIIFNVISGVKPFAHELYKHIFGVFDALEMPYDMSSCTHLYKVLPCNKEEFFNAIHYDPTKRKFIQENPRGIHFAEFDYGSLNNRKSFVDTLKLLSALSGQIDKKPVSALVPQIFELLNKYFWGFKKSQINRFPETDEIMQGRVLKYFQSPLLYSEFFREYQRKKEKYNKYSELRAGLTVSTFHSLKGLEFDNVIVVCMDNDLFPNYPFIDSRKYDSAVTQALKEAEVRLWYVTLTRARNNVTVYYSNDNPSLYVQFALHDNFPVAGHDCADGEAQYISGNPDEGNVSDFEVSDELELLDMPGELDVIDDLGDIDDLGNMEDIGNIDNLRHANDVNLSISEEFDRIPHDSSSNQPVDWGFTADSMAFARQPDSSHELKESANVAATTESNTVTQDDNICLKSGKRLYINRLIQSL